MVIIPFKFNVRSEKYGSACNVHEYETRANRKIWIKKNTANASFLLQYVLYICNTTTWVCMFKLESNILCFLANGWRKVNLHKFHKTNGKATSTCHVNASILKIYLFYPNISFSWNPCKYIPIFAQHYFSRTIKRFYIF